MDVQLENEVSRSPEDLTLKAKSSHRMHYEAQVEVIRRQLGDLDEIRGKLGLSQRKICQLLMVDPSAWTRWMKNGDSAPPHIYRALQWYAILREKLPGLTPQYFIGKDPEVLHQAALQRIQIESQKRGEFEEAFSMQSLQLENKLQELLSANQKLMESKVALEAQVQDLKAAVLHNRLGFFLIAIGGLILSFSVYWNFLR
ncbi:MAG: hypothetical protein ACAH59_10225 [Pseudobdellovibrionaceae bacterium]